MQNEELRRQVLNILDSDYQLDADIVRSKEWCVVPVESGSHFDDSDIQKIANALNGLLYGKLNAVLLDSADEVEKHISFDSSVQGLHEFNEKCSHFNYVICPDDLSFLIVCTTYDYFVLAGSQSFVESVLGTEVENGRKEFELFVKDEAAALQYVESRCKEISTL